MDIFGLHLDKNIIANNWVPIALWAITTTLLKFLWKWIKVLWSKLILKITRRIPKLNKVIKKILWFLSLFSSPLSKFIYLALVGLTFPFLLKGPYGFLLSVFVALVSWSLYSEVIRIRSRKDPIFSDTFENLRSWNTISGNPRIDRTIGNPSPSLFLPIVANNPNNSCIEIRELEFNNGIIEADIFLEGGSLVNIVFRADFTGGFNSSRYYMARFDSRLNSHNGFLKNEGNGWSFIAESQRRITPNQWHRIQIVVSGEKFDMFDENGFIISVNDGTFRRGAVGIFNEVANVYIDNFSIRT